MENYFTEHYQTQHFSKAHLISQIRIIIYIIETFPAKHYYFSSSSRKFKQNIEHLKKHWNITSSKKISRKSLCMLRSLFFFNLIFKLKLSKKISTATQYEFAIIATYNNASSFIFAKRPWDVGKNTNTKKTGPDLWKGRREKLPHAPFVFDRWRSVKFASTKLRQNYMIYYSILSRGGGKPDIGHFPLDMM